MNLNLNGIPSDLPRQDGIAPEVIEAANLNGDQVFVSHDFVQNDFDDIVIWISPNILINRMVAAGKLP